MYFSGALGMQTIRRYGRPECEMVNERIGTRMQGRTYKKVQDKQLFNRRSRVNLFQLGAETAVTYNHQCGLLMSAIQLPRAGRREESAHEA